MIEWRTMPSHPDYEISEFGSIRRLTSRNNVAAGFVLKPRIDKDGYFRVNLCREGIKTMRGIHQLVAEAFLGEALSDAHQVAHNDGSKRNNHYSNLRWATCLENQRDRYLHGTSNRGLGNANTKLSEEDIRDIRKMYADGCSKHEIARKFDMTYENAHAIVIGRTWKHLPL